MELSQNGFSQIPNEIFEAKAFLGLSSNCSAIFDCLIRHTFGFFNTERVKVDNGILKTRISYSKIAAFTNIANPNNISRYLKTLSERGIITRENGVIGVVIDITRWVDKRMNQVSERLKAAKSKVLFNEPLEASSVSDWDLPQYNSAQTTTNIHEKPHAPEQHFESPSIPVEDNTPVYEESPPQAHYEAPAQYQTPPNYESENAFQSIQNLMMNPIPEYIDTPSSRFETPSTEEKQEPTAKEVEQSPSTSNQMTKISADFKCKEGHIEHAEGKGLDIEEQRKKFIEYHTERGSEYPDWDKSFSHWLQIEYANTKKRTRSHKANKTPEPYQEPPVGTYANHNIEQANKIAEDFAKYSGPKKAKEAILSVRQRIQEAQKRGDL